MINKKIVLIGGHGFLGQSILDDLIHKKVKSITVIDSKNNTKSKNSYNFIQKEIEDIKDLEKIFYKSFCVINLAGISNINSADLNPLTTFNRNCISNIKILDACVKAKVKKYIFPSSVYVNGNYGGFYNISKKTNELIVKEYHRKYKLDFLVFRYGSLFGTGSDEKNGLHKIILNILKSKKINLLNDDNITRSFINVLDAARFTNDYIFQNKVKNKIINIVGTDRYKLNEILIIISNILNIDIKYKKIDNLYLEGLNYSITPYKLEDAPLNYKGNFYLDFEDSLKNLIEEIKINENL